MEWNEWKREREERDRERSVRAGPMTALSYL